ncbi:MAG: polyprenol monophosphomannose synthase [Chloroflexi bacterium]|nr:polyprenol monophosphomannose synthase [Chloroflexota bacterium]
MEEGSSLNGIGLGEKYRLAIVIPTYNEAKNLPILMERLFALPLPLTKLIIVDDGSPDGTAEVARSLIPLYGNRLKVIERDKKSGLGTAYKTGFAQALYEGADYILQMDADLSHSPEYIPGLLQALDEADVVIGSRYTEGGGVDQDWGTKRRLLSSMANIGIRGAAGLQVKDSTTGFKAFRATALRSLKLDECRCKGFGFQAEVAYACQKNGHKIVEFPIIFYDRTLGKSKMSFAIIVEAMWHLALLRWRN